MAFFSSVRGNLGATGRRITAAAAVTGFANTDQSLLFASADSSFISYYPPFQGDRMTWTFSCWFKRVDVTSTNYWSWIWSTEGNNGMLINFDGGVPLVHQLSFYDQDLGVDIRWTANLRDPAAWYNLVFACDTTQSTAANRIRAYINGVELEKTSATNPSQYATLRWNDNYYQHVLGRWNYNGSRYMDMALSDINFVDGQQLTPSSFGETTSTTGSWVRKDYTGVYGRNGWSKRFNQNANTTTSSANTHLYSVIVGQDSVNTSINTSDRLKDEFYGTTTLLLNADSVSNGANNQVFTDSSNSAITVSRSGSVSVGRFGPFSQEEGKWSYYFDGSYDSVRVASSSAFALGTGNFTIEMWVNFSNYTSTQARLAGQFQSGTTEWQLYKEASSNAIKFNTSSDGDVLSYTWGTINLGQWYHIAVVRSGIGVGQTAMYIDGKIVSTGQCTRSLAAQSVLIGGLDWAADFSMNGYISNFRYSNTARTITVPTLPYSSDASTLVLMAQSQRVREISSGRTLTYGASGVPRIHGISPFTPSAAYSATTNGGGAYFDGTSDYLSTPTNSVAVQSLGTGNYTIEGWFFPTSFATDALYRRLWSFGSSLGDSLGLHVDDGSISGAGRLLLRFNDIVRITSTQSIFQNAWNHVAVVRLGGTTYIYINGVAAGSDSTSDNLNTAGGGQLFIGGQVGGSTGVFSGHISDFRVTKSAVYSGAFSAPTAPLGQISNCSLLLNFTNGGIVDATGRYTIETVGSTSVSTSVFKYGTGSLNFNGTDYAVIKQTDEILVDFRAADYTIEMWMYPTAFASSPNSGFPGYSQSQPGTTSEYFSFGVRASGVVGFYYYNGATPIQIIGNLAIRANEWSHIAMTYRKADNTVRIFVNGLLCGSGTLTTPVTAIGDTDDFVLIGAAASGRFNGYIDDLRVTRGLRYHNDFTVPNQKFAYNVSDVSYHQFKLANFKIANKQSTNANTYWSRFFTYGDSSGRVPNPALFDGTATAGFAGTSKNGVTQTFTPPYGIPYNKLEVLYGNGNNNPAAGAPLSLNGVQVDTASSSSPGASKTYTTTTPGVLTSLSVGGGVGGSYESNIQKIKIDDVYLIEPIHSSLLRDTPVSSQTNSDTGIGAEVLSNYATLNPIFDHPSTFTLDQGNLRMTSASSWTFSPGTIAVNSGKWYFEAWPPNGAWSMAGVEQISRSDGGRFTSHIGGQAGTKGVAFVFSDAGARFDISYNGNNSVYTGGGTTYTKGTVISIALDLDTNNIRFWQNGVLAYNLSNILEANAFYTFAVSLLNTGNITANFGQRPWAVTPPSGFKALCAENLPAPAIVNPSSHFKAIAYAGTNTQAVTGVGFQPDLVWVKSRDNVAYNHQIHDSVRGATAGMLVTNSQADEDATYQFDSFDSNGFTTDASNITGINNTGTNFVAWNWKASNATAVTNTSGSLTSSVKVNSDAGFSIVSYVGNNASTQTVGHGLDKTPAFIIAKCRNKGSGTNWVVYHQNLGNTSSLLLFNDTSTTITISNYWGTSNPTSTVFGVNGGTAWDNNTTGVNTIAYVWAEIPGYSKFGKYTGNGNVIGQFVNCGFRPALIWIKSVSDVESWVILDNARNPRNVVNNSLLVNANNTENAVTAARIQTDFLSNGFKLRGAGNGGQSITNKSNSGYVFCAWAENPFKYANGR